jgi:polar amino acid transport system substrate-binding protein
MVAAGKEGQWDIVLMGVSAERAEVIDFSAPFILAESGYLVRKDLAVANLAEVDRPGIRIGVFAKSSADNELSKVIKNATLVRAPNVGELYAMLAKGSADVLAAAKSGLYVEQAKADGSIQAAIDRAGLRGIVVPRQ